MAHKNQRKPHEKRYTHKVYLMGTASPRRKGRPYYQPNPDGSWTETNELGEKNIVWEQER